MNILSYKYKGLIFDLATDGSYFAVYDFTSVLHIKQKISESSGEPNTFTQETAKKAVNELIDKSIAEVTKLMDWAYGDYMSEEAADRGYDHDAARAHYKRYLDYKEKVDALVKLRNDG